MSTWIHAGILEQNGRAAVSHGQSHPEQHSEGYCPLVIV